jgi:hypothetical protein
MCHTQRPQRIGLDPYLQFYKLLGGKPQVFAHADDLTSGTITTWNGRPGSVNLTAVGSPTVNASGWAGGGSATMKTASINGTSQYFTMNSEASNYSVGTGFIWVVAAKWTASAAGRDAFFLGSSSSGINYRGWTINATSDYSYMSSNRNGSTEFDTGSIAVSEGVQGIWAIVLTAGGTAIHRQLLSSGSTTLVNTSHTMTGTLTVDRFTIGARVGSGTAAGYIPGELRFMAALRSPSITHDVTSIDKVLTYVRKRLRCPL